MRECTCADIQFVQSAKVGSYPDDFLCGIIIKGFHVTVGDAVASLSGKIPLELTCPAVVEVQSASFRANPQISVLIFNGASDYGTAYSFFFMNGSLVSGIDFIFGVEVIDTAEVSTQP